MVPTDEELSLVAGQVVTMLADAGESVAAAESCTGGWVAKALTDIAGSSAVFGVGLVTYSNAAKQQFLNVPDFVLDKHGAVSRETVTAMAEGLRAISGADYAVAVSGIAGPDGGSEDKPVGTVWFAWARRDGDPPLTTGMHRFEGNRDEVRRQAVLTALAGLLP
ncbi:MAG: CinA family protein [Chromatiales bacterium]|mgnify:FL=1|jgi:nicotinamide-nucleotide amidase|nr:CinA family protein [Chromatiales bacterium]MDH3931537.1 CinA family protein [Chromatiales bacterium]MDH3946036.1 CinA family protein [Chromatiales bacterium]